MPAPKRSRARQPQRTRPSRPALESALVCRPAPASPAESAPEREAGFGPCWTKRVKAGTRASEVRRVRRHKRSSWLPGVAAFCLVALEAHRASAFENEVHTGVKGGFAFQKDRDVGWAVGAHGAYGLSDM